MDKAYQVHPIPPVYDSSSRVLILGSFPSVRSREEGFFYGHPRNRFWCVLAELFGEKVPKSTDEKRKLLYKHGIALWDTIASCEIRGSADSSITNAVPNDLSPILALCPGIRIFTNGQTSDACYRKYLLPTVGREAVCLPSTSPANAAWSFSALCEAWRVITKV